MDEREGGELEAPGSSLEQQRGAGWRSGVWLFVNEGRGMRRALGERGGPAPVPAFVSSTRPRRWKGQSSSVEVLDEGRQPTRAGVPLSSVERERDVAE